MKLDRRVIYVLIFAAISLPLLADFTLKPVELSSAAKIYTIIDELEIAPGEIAFIALDFGPSTKAENQAQAEVLLEHLLRRRVPFALFSLYHLAEPFLIQVPERVARRLEAELPGEKWVYGTDWVNLGYRPGASVLIQNIPKSRDLRELFKKDARGNDLGTLPAFREVRTLKDIKLLAQFTGLGGVFYYYVQFFQSAEYRPIFVHGCTSITIPEAYIYLDSGQLQGLFEGVAGAAWYSEMLSQAYPEREADTAAVVNTMLGVAHLVIIGAILLGNLAFLRRRYWSN